MTTSNQPAVSTKLLRWLLVLQVVCIVLTTILTFPLQYSLPEPLQAYLEASAEADPTPTEWVLIAAAVILFGLWFFSMIGLWFLWPPARACYFWLTVALFSLIPLLGPAVAHGCVSFFEYVGVLLNGATLGLLYWSPLKEKFTRQPILKDTPAL